MDVILKSQFLSMYCMILADGIIDARELETFYKIGIEQYDLSQEEINETIRSAGSSFTLPDTLDGKIRFLFNMAQIAYADEEIDSTEINLLRKYIAKMDFAEENAGKIIDYLFDAIKKGVTVDEFLQNKTL